MIRFCASEEEIKHLLDFLYRRMPGGARFVPLLARDHDDLRLRRTPRPLLSRLAKSAEATAHEWGFRPADDADASLVTHRAPNCRGIITDPEASRLMVISLGPVIKDDLSRPDCPQAENRRRRCGLLEVRDWEGRDERGAYLLPQAMIARALVERAARHIRRRAVLHNGHWHLP